MARTSRAVHLAAVPSGVPSESDFALVESAVPDPRDGEVLVGNVCMSVEPYMRARLVDPSANPLAVAAGQALAGPAIGRVEASRDSRFAEGDYVSSRLGWRECFSAPGGQLEPLAQVEPPPASYYLGVLGGTGFTAYAGMVEVGAPRAGETVFISGATSGASSCAARSLSTTPRASGGACATSTCLFRRSLTVRGFRSSDYEHRRGDFLREMLEWTSTGVVLSRETVVEGIERAAGAFIGLFRGENVGKMIVALDS